MRTNNLKKEHKTFHQNQDYNNFDSCKTDRIRWDFDGKW